MYGKYKNCLRPKLLFFDKNSEYAIIVNKNYSCLFQCESLWQAENVVFEPLRMSSRSIFIVDLDGDHYGWVSPLAGKSLLS
ncbi:sporulation inhibitor of replication protein SirA [Halobacillus sp.]|uniref:sporulation inhibitor of replication protein SirA n=1 Tax=Halobacillus sp. TaxID=56800 RepID=UPI003BB0243A